MNNRNKHKYLFNNLNGCKRKFLVKRNRNSNLSNNLSNISLANIPEIDRQNLIFGRITISMRYLTLNQDGTVNESKSKTINIKNSSGEIGFDSLQEGINSLNSFIQTYDIKYIPFIDIVFGNGTTWVMPSGERNLTGIGNAYSTKILKLDVGRDETYIGRFGLYGIGQGTSTIRGSSTLNVYNLGALPIITDINMVETEDSLQFDNRLILNNLFWIGKLAINVYYPTNSSDPVTAPIYSENKYIFDKNTNHYDISDGATYDDISNWTLTRRPEVEIINVWVELEESPIITKGENKGNSLIEDTSLDTPLFFINTPAMSRFFMVQTNIMTYLRPQSTEVPVALFATQFLTPGVNDTFVQDCSFSTRAFGSSTPDYTCCTFVNNGKVSILDSQFNGALICQCDKLALFGCYMLGVGIISSDPSDNPTTTPGLIMIPPTGKAVELAGYPQNDARFIQSCCEWVSYINHWGNEDKDDINKTISDNCLDPSNNFIKQQMILPWRLFLDSTNQWSDEQKLAIFFNGASFYMVDPEVKGDLTSGFTFNCITLTNTETCQLDINQTASLTGRLVIDN